jgi:hypothetical protein
MAILGLAIYLQSRRNKRVKILFFLITGLTVLWELPAFKTNGRVDFEKGYFLFLRNIRAGFHTFAVKWEYTPRNGAEKVVALGPRGNGRGLVETEFKIHFEAVLKSIDKITINQIYLPDWKIVVDNKGLDQKDIKRKITPEARIRIGPLPPGTHEVVAYYKGPPHSSCRAAVVMILVVFLIIFLFSYNKKALSRLRESAQI